MAGSANAVSTWTGEGGDFLFSTAANWQDENVPSLEELNAEIAFPAAAAGQTITNDLGAIQVTKISFSASTAVTLDATPGSKFTELTTITTSSSVHNVFNCPVECKSGTTVDIPRDSGNYAKFIGGLKTQSLAFPENLTSASLYYMGNIEVLTSDYIWTGTKYAGGQRSRSTLTTRVVIVSGSNVYIPNACLNWVKIEEGATLTVSNLTTSLRFYGDNNSNRFMQNYKSWYAYWTRAASECDGTLRVLDGLSFSGQDCFMPDTSVESSIMVVKGIKNSSTTATTGTYKGCPYVYLNQGYRTPKSGNALGTVSHTGHGRIALGSGGLQVVSGAYSTAKFIVGSDTTIKSFEDWALAAHPTKGNVALNMNATLTIDTDHYVTGDPEIDDGATTHTVNINGVINGSGALLVSGGGKVVFNSVCSYSNWTKVAGEAVLKVGSKPGASTLSVWSNGKLTLPDSGTVTLATNIVVTTNCKLRFIINDKADTNKLSTIAVDHSGIGSDVAPVNVYVEAPEEQYMRGFTPYTLITVTGDTKLATEDLVKFKLQDKPSWAHRLDIVDGNLVLWPSEPGLSLSVR